VWRDKKNAEKSTRGSAADIRHNGFAAQQYSWLHSRRPQHRLAATIRKIQEAEYRWR
jgi:hypothetical protein